MGCCWWNARVLQAYSQNGWCVGASDEIRRSFRACVRPELPAFSSNVRELSACIRPEEACVSTLVQCE